MEFDSDYRNLFISALFHDIGKFFQRTGLNHDGYYSKYSIDDFGLNGAHSKWSASFIESYWDDYAMIEDLILHHHNPTCAVNVDLCHMLTKADHHSASERIESDNNLSVNAQPLISVFSNVSLFDNNTPTEHYLKLEELNINKNFNDIVPKEETSNVMSGYTLEREYNILWRRFNSEFAKIRNLNDFNTLLSVLRKYTSFIPSAVYKSRSDISLYDHSKTTAALAVCRYLYNKENNEIFNTSDKEQVYLLVNGDLSGIQKFIFKISSPQDAQKGMSKRLRGRSLYLSLLTEAIVDDLVSKLGLTSANILFCAGGRFTLLAPNTSNTKRMVDDLKDKINDYFIKQFNAELYLALVYTRASGEELSKFNVLSKKLNNQLANDKNNKFSNQLDDLFSIENKISYKNLCHVCGNKTNNDFCSTCNNHEQLGRVISNAKYMIKIRTNEDNLLYDLYIKPCKTAYKFVTSEDTVKEFIEKIRKDDNNHIEVSKLNDTDFIDLIDEIDDDNISYSFKFLGNIVPKHSSDGVFSFEQLATISEGSNKLGILKMDVDNLGLIFSEGLKEEDYSISRVSTLSSYMEIFFSGIINNIADKYRVYESDDSNAEIKIKTKDEADYIYLTRKTNTSNSTSTIYIDYSGGDDLLVIGPYDNIIEFSLNLRNKFKEWTCHNDSINLSAGITLINSKFPIGKAVELCEENLEKSKSTGKDKITLFDEIMLWENNGSIKGLQDSLNFAKQLEKYTKNGEISKNMSYSFLKLWQNHIQQDLNYINEKEWKKNYAYRLKSKSYLPIFKYKIRLIKDNKIRNEIDEQGIKYMPWMKIPITWVSLKTR